MTIWREWIVSPILKDFKQKELLPLKIIFFVHVSTILVFYPYLTIHMRQLGISVEETAIMSAITPVVGILMPPLAGMLADKIGNFKILLTLCSVASGLSALLLLTIPIGRITITYPDRIELGMSCHNQNPLTLSFYQEYPCEDTTNMSFFTTKVHVESCGFVCHAFLSEYDDAAVLRSQHFEVLFHNVPENKTKSARFTLPATNGSATLSQPHLRDEEISNHLTLFNDLRYTTMVRRFSKHSYFFPTPALFNFSCSFGEAINNSGQDFQLYNNSHIEQHFELPTNNYECQFNAKNVIRNFTAALRQVAEEDDVAKNQKTFKVKSLDIGKRQHDAMCSEGYGQNKEFISIRLDVAKKGNNSEVYKTLDLGTCASRCLATAPRAGFCSNAKRVIERDVQLTFWSYLVVRVFIGIIGGTAYTLFEGAVIAILREYKADYGLQRMYAQIGGMISSPLSGLLIDYASRGKAYTNFQPIFILYCVLKVTSAILMYFINLEFKAPAKSVVADVKSVIRLELVSLFCATFLLGSAWGYIESFLFWLLEDLGGTKSLMGLTITVGGILGIPLLAMSGPLIDRFGHANIIFVGFLAYAIRLYGYSVIYNPWYALFFEALECVTHSLCFTALVTYAAKLSSVTTDTTVQGIIGGLFYGVGKSAGSLAGGFLIKAIGMRGTFQLFAAITGMTAFLYLLFYHLYMKKNSALRAKGETSNGVENTGIETNINCENSNVKVLDANIRIGERGLTCRNNLGFVDTEQNIEFRNTMDLHSFNGKNAKNESV